MPYTKTAECGCYCYVCTAPQDPYPHGTSKDDPESCPTCGAVTSTPHPDDWIN